jgi:hypothetical protein
VSCSLDPNSITTAKSSAGLQQSSRSPPWCRLFWRQPPLTFCANHLEPSGSILMSALPPKADMCRALIHVRYGPKADISRKRVSSQLFDNFVSDRKHTRWNGQPQGWLKHKLEFSSLAHRHIGGPFIFKNPLWGLTPHWRGEYGRGLGPRRPSFAHRAGPAIMGPSP